MKMFQWSHEDERLCPQTWPDRSSSRVNKSNCRRGVLAAKELAVDEDANGHTGMSGVSVLGLGLIGLPHT